MGVWRLCWPPKNDERQCIRRMLGTAISLAGQTGPARTGRMHRDLNNDSDKVCTRLLR